MVELPKDELILENIYASDNAKLKDRHHSILYQLLLERKENESISHNDMPSWGEHVGFIEKKPYKGWYVVYRDEIAVGSIYLTYKNEIGIAIFEKYRRLGLAKRAIVELMGLHREDYYLANINPANQKSIALFTGKFGFKHIQNTYRLDRIKNS